MSDGAPGCSNSYNSSSKDSMYEGLFFVFTALDAIRTKTMHLTDLNEEIRAVLVAMYVHILLFSSPSQRGGS